MKKNILVVIIFSFLSISCMDKKQHTIEEANSDNPTMGEENKIVTKADTIISNAISAHGGNLYETANYSFVFRDKKYSFKNNNNIYIYSSEIEKKDSIIKDVLTNDKFERYINNKLQVLTEEENSKYTEALNSVIYFATLPHKLKDVSANKKYIEERSIKGEVYEVIEVTFKQEGGGKDFEDEFYYWINQKTNKIDYLAYNYKVNKGGVRFRSAYNTRIVGGITFQDYINYEAPLGTPLKVLPKLFEEGKLKELSRIEIENINNHNK